MIYKWLWGCLSAQADLQTSGGGLLTIAGLRSNRIDATYLSISLGSSWYARIALSHNIPVIEASPIEIFAGSAGLQPPLTPEHRIVYWDL